MLVCGWLVSPWGDAVWPTAELGL